MTLEIRYTTMANFKLKHFTLKKEIFNNIYNLRGRLCVTNNKRQTHSKNYVQIIISGFIIIFVLEF